LGVGVVEGGVVGVGVVGVGVVGVGVVEVGVVEGGVVGVGAAARRPGEQPPRGTRRWWDHLRGQGGPGPTWGVIKGTALPPDDDDWRHRRERMLRGQRQPVVPAELLGAPVAESQQERRPA
jgi:hypothetical protein